MNRGSVLGSCVGYFLFAVLFRDSRDLAMVFSTAGLVMFGILLALVFDEEKV